MSINTFVILKYCSITNIKTGFVKKGRAGKEEANLKQIRKSINIKRATEMEGAFDKHKNHYGLNRVKARTKKCLFLKVSTYISPNVCIIRVKRKLKIR